MEDISQCILAASLGTNLLARRVREGFVFSQRHSGSRFCSTTLLRAIITPVIHYCMGGF